MALFTPTARPLRLEHRFGLGNSQIERFQHIVAATGPVAFHLLEASVPAQPTRVAHVLDACRPLAPLWRRRRVATPAACNALWRFLCGPPAKRVTSEVSRFGIRRR